jgi:uncharacterized cofD-like protein
MPKQLSDTKAVVIGGGTGAPVSIRALLGLGVSVSAVVAMADDGGSTGVLREQLGIMPVGDIRKCLASMAADPNSAWAQAFSKRLSYVDNHPLGNLMLSTLFEATESLPTAIELCEELLGARGRVLPSTLDCVTLSGLQTDGQTVVGQALLTQSSNALVSVHLCPDEPKAYEAAIDAIIQADLVVLGPGSLFTSIIPNLLVPDILDAISKSKALKVFLCSLADMQGETRGMSASEHVKALLRHGMQGLLDICVVHEPEPLPDYLSHIKRVRIDQSDYEEILATGVRLIVRPLVDPIRPTWHSVPALAELFTELLNDESV